MAAIVGGVKGTNDLMETDSHTTGEDVNWETRDTIDLVEMVGGDTGVFANKAGSAAFPKEHPQTNETTIAPLPKGGGQAKIKSMDPRRLVGTKRTKTDLKPTAKKTMQETATL